MCSRLSDVFADLKKQTWLLHLLCLWCSAVAVAEKILMASKREERQKETHFKVMRLLEEDQQSLQGKLQAKLVYQMGLPIIV